MSFTRSDTQSYCSEDSLSAQFNNGRKIPGIVFCGPDRVARNLEWRQTDPFAFRSTVIIEIQTWMIEQDLEAASNQEHHEEKINKMAVGYPEREPMRSKEVVGITLRHRRNGGQTSCRNSIQEARTAARTTAPIPMRMEGRTQIRKRRPLGSALRRVPHRRES
jgi:hypothetical protein